MQLKNMSFEKYLEDVAPSGVHINNSPEGFERWLEEQDANDIMQYAEYYGQKMYKQGRIVGMDEVLDGLTPHIEALKNIKL